MYIRDDWSRTAKRHLAWWEGSLDHGPLLTVTAPRAGSDLPDFEALIHSSENNLTYEKFWTDIDYVIRREEDIMEKTLFAGDAIPFYMPFLGPVIHGAFVGCPVEFNSIRTGWQHPFIDSWDNAQDLMYDPDNRWWNVIQNLTRAGAESGKGTYVTGITDMGGPGDDLAALRGTQNALMDFIDSPEKVSKTIETMCRLWKQYIDDIYSIITESGQKGSAGTFGIWSPGKSCTLQSDFSCMLSPDMFNIFLAPWIDWQAQRLDHAIYHIDGPDALHHINSLLAIESIDAFNWIPGQGQPPMNEWTTLIRKIQDAGRPVQVGASPDQVESILKDISPRGICISVSCSTEEEALELVRKAEKWGKDYDKPFTKKPAVKYHT